MSKWLRVTGEVFLPPDHFWRHRPVAGAEVLLKGMESAGGRLQPINSIQLKTNSHGRFDKSVKWSTSKRLPGSSLGVHLPLPDPIALQISVTDPSSQAMVSAGLVF